MNKTGDHALMEFSSEDRQTVNKRVCAVKERKKEVVAGVRQGGGDVSYQGSGEACAEEVTRLEGMRV